MSYVATAKGLLERYSWLLGQFGIHAVPYSDPELKCFQKLTDKRKAEIVRNLRINCRIHDDMLAERNERKQFSYETADSLR